MDFLDPKKKRAHEIRLYIGYALVTIALLTVSVILVYAASGYGIDRKTGNIIQNGLLFVDSHPEKSNVYINGQNRGQTDNRYVLEEGAYNLELRADGYRTWKHSFTSEGGSVDRFVYPFLFPNSPKMVDTQLYAAAPDIVSASPDRHWIISHQAATLNSFDVVDISSKNTPSTTVQIPAKVLPPKTGGVLKLVEWSTDNKHVLLQYTYTGGQDFILFDRDTPANSVNLAQVYGKTFDKVQLRDKKADQFYVYTTEGGVLQSADLKAKTITPLMTKVLSFWPYQDDTVLYATADGAADNSAFVKLRQNDKTYNIRQIAASSVYLLNMAEFDNHLYVAVGSTTEGRVYVYKDLLDDLHKSPTKTPLPRILLKVDNPEFVSFSDNARFIAVQGGSKFAVYDAEDVRQIRYDTKLQVDAHLQAPWMDGHRLSLPSQGKLNIFDFDGTNLQVLNDTSNGFIPMFDRDYNYLFTVSPSTQVKGRTALVRSTLKISLDK